MGGAFDHEKEHDAAEPFTLPKSWHTARQKGALQGKTPFNFVASMDIIGGNSGSPVIDRDGNLAGLIFDGNIHALVGAFVYDGRVNRGVSVDCRAILHAQDAIYGMQRVLKSFGK